MNWINLSDRVPIHNEIVLCADELNDFVTIGRYNEIEDEFIVMFIDKVEIDSQITHWMPLPEVPKE